jgi:hypothetical protein
LAAPQLVSVNFETEKNYPAGAEMSTTDFDTVARKRPHGAWWKAMAIAHAAVGFILVGLGALTLAHQPWHELQQHIQTRHWPTTQAQILAVSLQEVRQHSGAGDRMVADLLLGVAYEYEVDGQVREGTRASFSDLGDTYDRRLRALYRKLDFARIMQRSVPVSYDPQDPGNAFLDRGFEWQPFLLHGGIALAGIIAGMGLIGGTVRQREAVSSL